MLRGSPDDLLDSAEVAAVLNVDRETVIRYRVSGRIPQPDQYFGRTPVWYRRTVDNYAKNLQKNAQLMTGRPEKATCPGCKHKVRVRLDGSFFRHSPCNPKKSANRGTTS